MHQMEAKGIFQCLNCFSHSDVQERSNAFSYKTWTANNHPPLLMHLYNPALSQSLDSQQKDKYATMDWKEISLYKDTNTLHNALISGRINPNISASSEG